ncbi:hypothetical protein JOB18_020105 [Solea senegalensis]|uniref:Endonuclease/exonuclease/phosphatase domain-containing protein n=1 Tax=Solea senegalensis TaxID=28829 RepID=A0AAV6RYD3_SOLSE|nr:hypothetical protein JOB18_020105 [Solea senegalensis]
MDKPRPEGQGSGVAAVHRKDIKTSTISIHAAQSFEHITFKLSGPTPLVTAIIYRPPKPNPSFVFDFSDFLTQLSAISPSVLLLGDFNIHINTNCKSDTEFLEVLPCFNLTQHVNFSTHSCGHILDLVCSAGLTIPHLSSLNLNISDHLAIIMDINLPIPTTNGQFQLHFRKLSNLCCL